VWVVLVVMALVKVVSEMAPLRALLLLLVPQGLSAYLFALYNFAITGSARPDALYLAWGPAGVSSARVGQGVLGLLLDARYGILPYAPVYLLAAGGLLLGGRGAARLRGGLPAMAAYYMTVASADNWAGAVCNLGRYFMPIAPWIAALAAVALAGERRRRGVVALTLILAAWTGLIAAALWADPHAANDCALLLARSIFADGNVYIPNLFIRTWSEAAPGLFLRVSVWLALIAALGIWIRGTDRGRGGASPDRALAGVAAALLAAALLVERGPVFRTGPRFSDALALGPGATAFLLGPVRVEEDQARARHGTIDLLVRSREPRSSLTVVADGDGTLRPRGVAPVAVAGRPVVVSVPLEPVATLVGRRGVSESIARQRLVIDTRGELVLRVK